MDKPANNTKRKIIKIAFDLFKEDGFDNVTVKNICDASGISKHTLYYYFDSKEQILGSLREIPRSVRPFELGELLNAENSFEKLMLTFSSLIDHFERLGSEVGRIILSMDLGGKRDKEAGGKEAGDEETDGKKCTLEDEHHKLQISLIEKAQEEGVIRNGSDAKSLCIVMHTAVMGLFISWVKRGGGFDIRNCIRLAAELILDVPEDKRKAEAGFDSFMMP